MHRNLLSRFLINSSKSGSSVILEKEEREGLMRVLMRPTKLRISRGSAMKNEFLTASSTISRLCTTDPVVQIKPKRTFYVLSICKSLDLEGNRSNTWRISESSPPRLDLVSSSSVLAHPPPLQDPLSQLHLALPHLATSSSSINSCTIAAKHNELGSCSLPLEL